MDAGTEIPVYDIPEENINYLNEILTTGKYKATNMCKMFYAPGNNIHGGSGYPQFITTLDVSNWDTSNVTDMSYMFTGAPIKSIVGIENFNTSKVTTIAGMLGTGSFPESLDLTGWDISNITDMSGLFGNLYDGFASTIKYLNICNWDTSKVINMESMFQFCSGLEIIDGIIDLTSCTDYYWIFGGYGSGPNNLKSVKVKLPDTISEDDFLAQVYPDSAKQAITFVKDLPNYLLDRNYITYADAAAKEEYNFDGKYGPIPNENGEIDLSDYANNYVAGNENITELPEENKKYLDEVLTTGKYKVINMASMFYGCRYLTSIDVSNWDTSNVTIMGGMFYGCNKLTSLDASNWNTSKVTNMNSMFDSCRSLTSLDASNWDTSKVTNMSWMFDRCEYLTSLDVSNWDTSKVTNMNNMFYGCSKLTSLDASNWNTSNVTDMDNMFYYCSKLTTITGTIDLASCTNYSYMLRNTSSLTSVYIKLPSTITQSTFLSNSWVTNKSAVHFVS